MPEIERRQPAFQFGDFELNLRTGELRKYGIRIKVQEQPLQILTILLERVGETVTREEIRKRLWPDGTYVDFDNAINSSVRKLREALCDSPEHPRFIETQARRGYRFIAPLSQPSAAAPAPRAQLVPLPSQTLPPLPTVPKLRTQNTRFTWVAALAGVLLVLLMSAAARLILHPETKATTWVPLPLTAAQGAEQSAAFSPDGSQIAYAWHPAGKGTQFQIYLKMIGSGRPVQLTVSPGSDDAPAWSPDGRNIAFLRLLEQGMAIWLIQPIGGTERKIVDGPFEGAMGWSPDSKYLAVAQGDSPGEGSSLFLVSAENGEKTRLTSPANQKAWDVNPTFSPDGKQLLFTRCDGPFYCGLYLLDLTAAYRPAGPARVLRQEERSIGGSAWTRDGKEVVYALSDDGGLNYHLMRVRTGTPNRSERLTYAGERSAAPAIAAHGDRLAYTQDLSDFDIWHVQPGKQPQSFLSSTRLEYNPQYSPDGKHIAFSSNRSGMMEIWVSNENGGNPLQLTRFNRHSGTPRWSPDAQWIAFDRHLNEGWRIFVMSSQGGPVRRLTLSEGHEIIPSWSRDGDWIYYASNRTNRFEIWKTNVHGGKGIQVTYHGGFAAFESPDGQWLYYVKGEESGLWAIPVRGGAERLILDSVIQRAFAVVQDGVYYIPKAGSDGLTSIRFHEFASGTEHEITRMEQDVFEGLTVSPDRKTILFSAETQTGSNVMIVENFQ